MQLNCKKRGREMLKKILLVCTLLSTIVYAKEVTVSILPQKYFVKKNCGW